MLKKIGVYSLFFFIICLHQLHAQRAYNNNSVLAKGIWFKIGVTKTGVYKIDVAFLQALGINTNALSSNTLSLFGNKNLIPNENNLQGFTDDLQEIAVRIVDGGDGLFNGNDYLLFYAQQPDCWTTDSANKSFNHYKNLYSDTNFYYLSVSNFGKRINQQVPLKKANIVVNSFDEHFFYENNQTSLLNSGKNWYGEEFSLINNATSKKIAVNLSEISTHDSLTLTTNFVCRSIGNASSFNVLINGLQINNSVMPTVSGGFLDAFASEKKQETKFVSTINSIKNITINFNAANSSAQGWLDWFEIAARKTLSLPAEGQLSFRDWQSVAASNIAQFNIANANELASVWDITDVQNPLQIATTFSNNQLQFVNNASILHEYIVFNYTTFLKPANAQKIENQNLHNSKPIDFIIVTNPALLPQAERLARFHTQHYRQKVKVATTEQISNEFGGGVNSPVAIRNFVKMYYDKADSINKPKYLCLFGAASFDYKNRIAHNTNLVPCYETNNSLDPLLSYTSDDFFALLKDTANINDTHTINLLDIGVGRIPAANLAEAKLMVDKIINYHSAANFGQWRNQALFVADDKDYNTHLNDAEYMAGTVANLASNINQSKIYIDAYPIKNTTSGLRYPTVNATIVNQLTDGALIFNYSGHGGYQRLSDEAIFTQTEVGQLNNSNKLPLFITATCDFAPFDDPTKSSIGHALLHNNNSGAIALMTTTRIVFAYSNRIINNNYLLTALQPNAQGNYLTLGEAMQLAKNNTLRNFSNDVYNNRKFTLLGDPAMQLAFPALQLKLTTVNHHSIAITDTLKALSNPVFEGVVTDNFGKAISNFNGLLFATVYDKPDTITTLANSNTSIAASFLQQNKILYRGKASVVNGNFAFSFVVPKDIAYKIGNGKISLYANNDSVDAAGSNTHIIIGGSIAEANTDTLGPTIRAYLNDYQFVNGGLTNTNPVLLVQLSDQQGINTLGTSIGHDITATLDGDENNIFLLNNYYEADVNSYQSGKIVYQLPSLNSGKHTLTIKARDAANNPGKTTISFVVSSSNQLLISNLSNYPNPVTGKTTFSFQHNQPNQNLQISIGIYNLAGKQIRQIKQNIYTTSTQMNGIEWNGKGSSNENLASGIYIYRIIVQSNNGFASATQQLYLR